MPYGLPKPWNPGYALPKTVADDELGRGARVTAQLPRGTYNVQRGAAVTTGYALPASVKAETPGQGVYVTAWAPRGTYYGGGQQMTALAGLGDDAGGDDAVSAYGRKAARYLLARARALPAHQRATALKTVLDHVDGNLWTQATILASKYPGPRPAALERGLAEAMSKGITTELVSVGRRGRAPDPKSLVGLGCYGCAAVMGDVVEALGATGRDHRGADTGTHGAAPPSTDRSLNGQPQVQIGPWTFPAGGTAGRASYVAHTSTIPSNWKDWIAARIQRVSTATKGWDGQNTISAARLGLDKWVGLKPNYFVGDKLFDGSQPILKAKDPVTGQEMGLYFVSTPDTLSIWYKPRPKPSRSTWDRIWDVVSSVPGKALGAVAAAGSAVIDYAGDALDKLGELGCQLVTSAAGQAAVAGAATAAGGPAAGAAAGNGTAIAGNVCATTPKDTSATVAPIPPPPGIPLGPLALIAGGVAAVYFIRKRG